MLDIKAPRVCDLHVVEFCLSELRAQTSVHTHVLSSQFCFSPTYLLVPGAACVSAAARGKFLF